MITKSDIRNNIALIFIGVVAAVGLLMVFTGVYLTECMSSILIVSGLIFVLISVIAWIIIALITIINLIREIIIFRRVKRRTTLEESEL